MNRILLLTLVGLATLASAQNDEEVPAADEWYRSVYAPVYLDKPWDKADEIASHFAETIHVHDEGGSHNNAQEWVRGALDGWKIEGWIRSELAELDIDLLNPTTASFKAKWRDFYTGGNISYECAWYLADYSESKWLITEYATISCSDHDL